MSNATPRSMDRFTHGYISCALWSSCDLDTDKPLDEDHDSRDIDPKTREGMDADCAAFQRDHEADLTLAYATPGYDESRAGHDFWLTRNRHGAGFWDRGLGEVGKRLTDAAHAYGEVTLYVGDDHRIHA